jgi:hypothetical protein
MPIVYADLPANQRHHLAVPRGRVIGPVSGFAETLSESSQTAGECGRGFGPKISDHRHRRLLCLQSDWPRRRRGAEQRDELTSPHIRTQAQGPALYDSNEYFDRG